MKRRIAIFIIVISIIFLIFLTINKLFNLTKEKDQWVKHTYKVVITSKKLLNNIKDAETGQRGFLLTLDESYLEPYNLALAKTKNTFNNLTNQEFQDNLHKSKVHHNKIQHDKIEKIEKLINLKFEELALTIKLARENRLEEAIAVVKTDLGKYYMQEIRSFIEQLIKEEYELLNLRIEEFNKLMKINEYIIISLFCLFVFLFYYIYAAIVSNKELEIENKEKEILLLQQSKMASMGDMIGNIAHQWRQPLNTISVSASSLQLMYSIKKLNQKDIDKFATLIIKNSEFLSKTIDSFRNFLNPQKSTKDVILEEEINEAIFIVENTLTNNNITLLNEVNYEVKTTLKLVSSELSHVVINLINNSKDALLERKVKQAWIKISLVNKEEKIIISVEDNAGGINENIKTKIFEPYFTTKHQSQGTGLGLYMTYKIVNDSLGGIIYVNNTENGAKFFVELPIK